MFHLLDLIKSRRVRVVALSLLLCLSLFVSAFAADPDDVSRLQVQDVSVGSVRISANQTSGFHAVILGLLGDYNPIVKDYTYQTSQGYISHSIEITPDWSWICTAAIFLVIIFCVFRLIGGLFSWKR